jgi:flagellar hook-basal body complex protein FliE
MVAPLHVPAGSLSPLAPSSEPDVPLGSYAPRAEPLEGSQFSRALMSALGGASGALERAADAESAFVHGRGGLQELVLERAQADVMLALATSAASRTAQSLSTIFNLQV